MGRIPCGILRRIGKVSWNKKGFHVDVVVCCKERKTGPRFRGFWIQFPFCFLEILPGIFSTQLRMPFTGLMFVNK